MNRLSKILLIFFVALTACNPTESLKKQLEQQAPPPKATFNYTLTNDDYTTIAGYVIKNGTSADSVAAAKIKSSHYLPGNYDKTYIPELLSNLYPALGNKSSAHVTYNYYNGPLASTLMYEAAPQYTLSDADYQSMGGVVAVYKYFSPSNPATNFIPALLSAKYPSDTNGTVRLIKYNFANSDPSGEATVLDAEFAKNISLENFTVTNVSGAQTWTASKYGAKMSGYSNGKQANEDWLVSPAIDLSGFANASFQVSQTINYWNKTVYPEHIQILVSTDYSGDVTTATWTALNVSPMPDGTSWTEVQSNKIDLSAYAGKKIYIAFKYVSTTTDAPTWEIDWMKVYGTVSGGGTGPAPTVLYGGAFYELSGGTWGPVKGTYYLSSADYASMGGSIGKYDDFSSSNNPDNYLPQFLTQKYPYAQEGDQIYVAYKYYSGGLHTYVDQYTFTNSMWTKYDPVVVVTNPFLNNGTQWVFDPTVYKTITASDYQTIVNVVKNTHPDLVNSYGDAETYFGADAYRGNFNAQISKRAGQADFNGLSDTQATALILKRIGEGLVVMLQQEYPNATTQVSGVVQKYVITYNVYVTSNVLNTTTLQCTKSGPNPEFKIIGGTPHE